MSTTAIQSADEKISRTELTPELTDALCDIISHGHFFTTACKILRVNYITFQRWMRVGKVETEGIYHEFYERIMQADGVSEAFATEEWRKHFRGNHQAAMSFLERRWPDRWSQRKYVNVAVERELTQMLKELEQRLPPEIFSVVFSEISAIGSDVVLESGVMDDMSMSANEDEVEISA